MPTGLPREFAGNAIPLTSLLPLMFSSNEFGPAIYRTGAPLLSNEDLHEILSDALTQLTDDEDVVRAPLSETGDESGKETEVPGGDSNL